MADAHEMGKPTQETLPVSVSKVETNELVLPHQANTLGNVLGGHVMHLTDLCAAMAAMRHCRHAVVTAAVDNLSFLNPVKIGEHMNLKASVNYADHTSMEVGVRVEAENPLTGARRHTSSAYLTFVALDDNGRPVKVPQVLPESMDEKRRFEEAQRRRQERLDRRSRQ